jgi:hypothetical protein
MAFVGCGWATIDYTLDTDALGELRREVLVVDKTGNESPPEGARIGSYDDNATQRAVRRPARKEGVLPSAVVANLRQDCHEDSLPCPN